MPADQPRRTPNVTAVRQASDNPQQTQDFEAYDLFLRARKSWGPSTEDSIESIRTAMRMNSEFSHSGRFQVFMGFAQATAGRYADSAKTFEETLEDRGVHGIPGITVLAYIAASYSELGRDQEARQTVERLLEYKPDASISTLRNLHLYKNQNDRERVQNAVRRAGLPETSGQ